MSSHVDYQKFRKGEDCTEEGCRARKFYIEDGKKFCQRGHEQFGFTQTQQDEDDWNTQGKKTRKKREEKERVETILSGGDAKELYLQCYQLVLWKQCHWLVTSLGLPEELQVVVKDLWELRIRDLSVSKDEKSGYGSGTGTVMFSSASEGENTDTTVGTRKSRKDRSGAEKLPKLIETLAICYLGMLLLRIPVSLGDIYRWASQDRLVYTRAIKEIPKDMRAKLPAHFHSALEIRAPLKGFALHGTVLELVSFYNHEFEMTFPALNAPLLLFKFMKELCIPVEIYPAVRQLVTLLDLHFSYSNLPQNPHGVTPYPEVQLVSLLVIATKLAYPFDKIERVPESYSDPSAVKVDWSRWLKVTARAPVNGLARGTEIHVTDSEVWAMTGKELDDYLDWYQGIWLDDREPKISEQVLELFPLDDRRPHSNEEFYDDERVNCLKNVQRSLVWRKPQPVANDDEPEDIRRAGELYKRYRTVDELPKSAKAFFELAASQAGISLKMLVKCVFQFEVRLESWRLAERKQELLNDSSPP